VKRLILAGLSALALVFGLAAPAQADVYGWAWGKATITIADRTHTTEAKDAARRWDAVSPLSLPVKGGQDADITIRWGDLSAYGYAGTADWTFGSDGRPTHCEIVLSDRYKNRQLRQQWATTILLHELGHCLGLAHTTDLTVPSVMRAVAGSNFKYPQPYDIDQLRTLYP